MSVDGLLPKFFGDLHATNRTPYKTNLLLWYSLVYCGLCSDGPGHMVEYRYIILLQAAHSFS
jgi:APA family basic amino acid/polyamine antiporter